VVTTPGSFNPLNPTPAGQTLSGDHTYIDVDFRRELTREFH
jgi:hypothetical protein